MALGGRQIAVGVGVIAVLLLLNAFFGWLFEPEEENRSGVGTIRPLDEPVTTAPAAPAAPGSTIRPLPEALKPRPSPPAPRPEPVAPAETESPAMAEPQPVPVAAPAATPAPETPPAPAPATARSYTVAPGDTFWSIAKKVYGDPSLAGALKAANGNPRVLSVGRTVRCPPLPGATFVAPASDPGSDAAPESTAPRVHTLRRGERLYDLARRYYDDAGRWREIVAANPGLDPRRLRAGQEIIIP